MAYAAYKEEEAEKARIALRYRNYEFKRTVESIDPKSAKRLLDELFVYKGTNFPSYGHAQFLLRFVGEHSVLDLWLGDYSTIEVFVNERFSDLPHVLSFSQPYYELMEGPLGDGLKFKASESDWPYALPNGLKRR